MIINENLRRKILFVESIKNHKPSLSIVESDFIRSLKSVLSGPKLFLATGSPFKVMKNAFYFALKALFVLKIFNFLSWRFGHAEKQTEVTFKAYDVTAWLTDNYNTHIANYLRK